MPDPATSRAHVASGHRNCDRPQCGPKLAQAASSGSPKAPRRNMARVNANERDVVEHAFALASVDQSRLQGVPKPRTGPDFGGRKTSGSASLCDGIS